METFMKIKEMSTHLSRDCFTEEQTLIIMGSDINNEIIFFSTQGNILFVISLLAEYIEKLEKNNPLEMTKFDILDMIKKTFEEDDILDMIKKSFEEDDKYDQTS